jgi:restriction endonuclease S subunit
MHDDNLARFVFHQFFSKRFTRYCEDRMTGTNYPAITPKDVFEFKVSIPNDINLVKTESKKLEEFDISIASIKKRIELSKSLQKSLINQVF